MDSDPLPDTKKMLQAFLKNGTEISETEKRQTKGHLKKQGSLNYQVLEGKSNLMQMYGNFEGFPL